jgi:H+/Cl- antiporter ClcA
MKITSYSRHWISIQKERLFSRLRDKDNIQNALLILASVVSGLVAVFYAKVFKAAETAYIQFISPQRDLVFIFTPLLFFVAWVVVFKFSPESSGSGIPQVLFSNELDDEGLHKKHIRRFLSVRVIITKTISSLICALGGGAIGREGPTLQISASIFFIFGERVKKYLPQSKSHLWIISGASAGLAAAFNTPLGGIIYAIEELGATHFSRVRTILLAAVVTSGLMSQWLLGDYLYLGLPKISTEGMSVVPMAVLVGAVAGLGGGLFSKILFLLSQRRKSIKSPMTLGLITLICGFSMAGLIFMNTQVAGSGIESLNEILFHGESADGFFVTARFFGTMLSYLSGAAGGIFSPSLAIGGSLGSYLAHLFNSPDQNIVVLLGMIGFLTGVTKTPFTSFILVVEMTNKHSAIFPMMVTALVAVVVSSIAEKDSFYEKVKKALLNEMEEKEKASVSAVAAL